MHLTIRNTKFQILKCAHTQSNHKLKIHCLIRSQACSSHTPEIILQNQDNRIRCISCSYNRMAGSLLFKSLQIRWMLILQGPLVVQQQEIWIRINFYKYQMLLKNRLKRSLHGLVFKRQKNDQWQTFFQPNYPESQKLVLHRLNMIWNLAGAQRRAQKPNSRIYHLKNRQHLLIWNCQMWKLIRNQ